MSLSTRINLSTCIRPLEERQLRMFQRAIGNIPDIPKVIFPYKKETLTLSAQKVTREEVHTAVRDRYRERAATLLDAVMDPKFSKRLRFDTVWVDGGVITILPKPEPYPTNKWYHINREKHTITPLSNYNEPNLEWHERLCISKTAVDDAKEGFFVALYGSDLAVGGQHGLYAVGYANFTRLPVALVIQKE